MWANFEKSLQKYIFQFKKIYGIWFHFKRFYLVQKCILVLDATLTFKLFYHFTDFQFGAEFSLVKRNIGGFKELSI